MFEDKELLNIILYEKRFTTYLVCVIMIVVGVALSYMRVPDSKVRAYYDANYPSVVYSEELNDKVLLEKDNNKTFVVNNSDKDLIGVYVNDKYHKINIKKSEKKEIKINGTVTGSVYEK